MRRLLPAVLALAACAGTPELGPLEVRERWFYSPLDLSLPRNVDKVCDLMARGARAGYNGVLLEDPNFGKLPLMDAAYFAGLERIKRSAVDTGIRIIPALFQLGHSENFIAQEPNLAEGLPVRGARFVVRGGIARLEADPIRLELDRKDDLVTEDLVLRDPKGRLARVVYRAKVTPFRQYHVSARCRTRDFKGTPRIVVIGGGKLLNFVWQGMKPTQDWTEVHATFNSLEALDVRVMLGAWDGDTGEAQWADPRIEEIGLYNVIRRAGAPLVVATERGPLKEGLDYEAIVDPVGLENLKRKVDYEQWHEPPAIRTKLPDGTRLHVDYYHAVKMPDNGQITLCPSEPRMMELFRDQARRLHEIFGARGYFMSFDEIRVLNWDESCRRRDLTPAQIVARAARECTDLLRSINPGGEIYTWSDVWDPFHNAHDHYSLVRGDLTGCWEGLDRDVIVANWYFDRREESLAWFASRGHRQICAAYYDKMPERARDWLESARKTKGVIGIMYTSWYDRYEDLETHARFVNEFR
jgi:hypothetical protein